jgi:hypothetical protein
MEPSIDALVSIGSVDANICVFVWCFHVSLRRNCDPVDDCFWYDLADIAVGKPCCRTTVIGSNAVGGSR